MKMPRYSVTVNRTRTIESAIEIEVSARDEESAQEKVEEKINKAVSDGKKLESFDWNESSDDDSFEYEANEL